MRNKVLVFPEINVVNLPFCLLLSLFFNIKTFKAVSIIQRFFTKRIMMINIEDHLNWEDAQIIRDDVVDTWGKIYKNINKWGKEKFIKVTFDNNKLIFPLLMKKLEIIIFCDKLCSKNNTCIVDDFLTRYIKLNYLNSAKDKISLISQINIGMYYLNLKIESIVFFYKVLFSYIDGAINNKFRSDLNFDYLYDGISPRELSFKNDEINFNWIVDEKVIKSKEVLFLLPKPDFQMVDKFYNSNNENNINHVFLSECNRLASLENIFLCFMRLLGYAVKSLFSVSFYGSINVNNKIKMTYWVPLIETLKPKVYISNISVLGEENLLVNYLNKCDVKTIAWSYGTNCFPFIKSENKRCGFKNVIFANIPFQVVIVWNNNFKEIIKKHPQDEAQVKVLGPLMSGKEDVFKENREVLCSRYNIKYNSKYNYIAVFDCPLLSYKFRGSIAWYPDVNTDEYNYALIKGVYESLPGDTILIYKPKRSLNSGKFSYSNKLQILFKKMENDERVFFLDYNVNPWVPIAIADVCVGLPFESPSIIALHYSKLGLFYDPFNIAKNHCYKGFEDLIAHDSEQLKIKINKYLLTRSNADALDPVKLKALQGDCPGESSTDCFREYLANLENKECESGRKEYCSKN